MVFSVRAAIRDGDKRLVKTCCQEEMLSGGAIIIGEIDGEHVMRQGIRFLRRLAGGRFAQRSGKRLAVNGPVRFVDIRCSQFCHALCGRGARVFRRRDFSRRFFFGNCFFRLRGGLRRFIGRWRFLLRAAARGAQQDQKSQRKKQLFHGSSSQMVFFIFYHQSRKRFRTSRTAQWKTRS